MGALKGEEMLGQFQKEEILIHLKNGYYLYAKKVENVFLLETQTEVNLQHLELYQGMRILQEF